MRRTEMSSRYSAAVPVTANQGRGWVSPTYRRTRDERAHAGDPDNQVGELPDDLVLGASGRKLNVRAAPMFKTAAMARLRPASPAPSSAWPS